MIGRVQEFYWQLEKIAKITLFSILLTNCSDPKPPVVPPKPNVSVLKVKTSYISLYKDYIGITQSIASIDIRARVQGFLIKKNFIEGKMVKKDQLLFMIDPRPFEAKLNLAQGQLSKSIAAKEYQQIEFLRMKDLVGKGDIAKSRFDEVTAQYREAVAQVEIQTAQVEQAKINLSYCSMYSPIDGIISHKYIDVGNLVGGAENTLLANIVQLNPIYVEFSPSTNDFTEFLKYRVNMPFKVELTLPHGKNAAFQGKVDLINNQADIPTSTILMRAIVDNPKNLLLPGIYVNLRLILTTKAPSILIPVDAVMQSQELRSVYVVANDNKVQSRTVTIAGQKGQQFIIKSGLKDGDMIVLNGLQKIQPGMEITPKSVNS